MHTLTFPLTVFYDASCPLCASEMRALKARDREDRLRLVDCSAPDFDDGGFAAEGITRRAMLARIHARDAHGRWLQGVDVFVEAYRAAGFDRVASTLAHPRVRPWFDRVYPWVARHRYALSRLGLFRLYDRLAQKAPATPTAMCQGACRSANQRGSTPGVVRPAAAPGER